MATGFGENIVRSIEQHKDKLDIEDYERIEEAIHPFPSEVGDDNDE